MSRFSNLQDVYSDVEREQVSILNQNKLRSGFTPTYINSYENRASFTPPSTGFVQNLFGKLAEQSINMGDGPTSLFLSPAGHMARASFRPGDAPLPINAVDGQAILSDGSVKPLEDLTGTDFFSAITPDVRTVLELNGVSPKQFEDIKTQEEAEERYNDIVRRVDLRQKIVRYNEVHPNFATTTGILGFALEVVADPTNLLSFGAGSVVKKGATAGAKAVSLRGLAARAGTAASEDGLLSAAKTVFKVSKDEGIDLVPSFLKNPDSSNRIASHLTASAYGGGGMIGFDALAQYAEYRDKVDNLGIKEQFSYDYMRGGFFGVLGTTLANLGALHAGRTPKEVTNNDIIAASPTSLVGRQLDNYARNGTAAGDARVNLLAIDVLGRIDAFARAAYTPDDYTIIMLEHGELDFIQETGEFVNKRTGVVISAEDLGTFVANGPTPQEMLSRLDGSIEGVETRISSINKELTLLSTELQEKAAKDGETKPVKKLRKTVRNLEAERSKLLSQFLFTDQAGVANRARPLVDDVPMTDIYGKQSDRLSRTDSLIAHNTDELPDDASGAIEKTTFSIFQWIAKLGSQGTSARHYQKVESVKSNGTAQVMARLFGAIDPRIANTHFADLNGKSVTSVLDNIIKVATKRGRFTLFYDNLMKGKTPLDEDRIGAEVMMLRTGTVRPEDVSEEARRLVDRFGNYYDEMAEQGVRNGSLRRKESNYINVVTRDGTPNSVFEELSQLLGKRYLDNLYRTGNPADDLHFGTLQASKVLDPNGVPTQKGVYESVPKKRSELTPEDGKLYDKLLESQVLAEARDSMSRRKGRHKGNPEDPVARDENRVIRYREDNRASRVLEQEFWLSPEVIATGAVETNLKTAMRHYERGMGVRIAQQETMTETFGEAVRFDDVVDVLGRRIDKMDDVDPHKALLQDALVSLKDMNQRSLGHVTRDATGLEKIIIPAVDLASSAIQQTIVIPMINEMILTVVRSLVTDSDKALLLKNVREVFDKNPLKKDLVSFGYISEIEKNHLSGSRWLGTDSIDPGSSVGKGIRWWKHKSRQWFGEDFLTSRMKRYNAGAIHHQNANKLYSVLDRLEKLDVQIDPDDPKAFAAIARAAGFGSDVALAKDIRRLGLHTKESRAAIAKFKELNKEALYHPDNAVQVAMQVADDDLRRAMLEVSDKLTTLSREATDRIIVTRSAGTALRDNDILGSMVFQFLTYPTTWFNAFLKRQSQGPNHVLAGYLTSYILSEVMVSMTRDVAFKGLSPEDVLKDWDDNFFEKIGLIATRVPIAGAWSDLVLAGPVSLATGNRARFGLSSNPAGTFLERSLNEVTNTSRRVLLDGETPTSEDFANLGKVFPVVGSPPIQTILRHTE